MKKILIGAAFAAITAIALSGCAPSVPAAETSPSAEERTEALAESAPTWNKLSILDAVLDESDVADLDVEFMDDGSVMDDPYDSGAKLTDENTVGVPEECQSIFAPALGAHGSATGVVGVNTGLFKAPGAPADDVWSEWTVGSSAALLFGDNDTASQAFELIEGGTSNEDCFDPRVVGLLNGMEDFEPTLVKMDVDCGEDCVMLRLSTVADGSSEEVAVWLSYIHRGNALVSVGAQKGPIGDRKGISEKAAIELVKRQAAKLAAS